MEEKKKSGQEIYYTTKTSLKIPTDTYKNL